MSREAMQRLVDALDKNDHYEQAIALTNIRTVLAQPEQILCRICSGRGWFTYPASDVRFECPACQAEGK